MDEATKIALEEQWHEEIRGDMASILKVLREKKDDFATKEFVKQNGDLISNFVKKLEEFSKQEAPVVKVETNQDAVIKEIAGLKDSIDQLIPLMKSLVESEKKEEKDEQWNFGLNKNGHGVTTGGWLKKVLI